MRTARRTEADRAFVELRRPAEALGIAQLVADASALPDPDEAEGLLEAWTSARRGQLAEVKEALAAWEDRVRDRTYWDRAVDDERATLEERAGKLGEAERAAAEAAEAYRSAVRAWVGSCELLEPGRLSAELPAPPDDPPAVGAAIGRVSSMALAEPPVALGAQVGPRSRERVVDVEDNGFQHGADDSLER